MTTAVHRLDVTELLPPDSLLEVRRRLDRLSPGEVLEVRTVDRDAIQNLPAICESTGHRLLMAREDEDGILTFRLSRPQS